MANQVASEHVGLLTSLRPFFRNACFYFCLPLGSRGLANEPIDSYHLPASFNRVDTDSNPVLDCVFGRILI